MITKILKSLKYAPAFRPFWKLMAFPIGSFLWFWLVSKTSTIKVIGNEKEHKGPAIYVNWHKHLPYLIHYFGRMKCIMLVSNAPYMEPIGKWCRWSGLGLVRGASGEDGINL